MANEKKVIEPDELFGTTPVFNGSMAEFEELLDWSFPISIGRNQEERDWKAKDFLFGEFIAKLTQHKESKKKNGACFMQGALVNGVKQRTIPNVRELSFMVLDIDSGQPMDEVRQELIHQDLFAILYTTYSHGTTQTKIKKTEIITKLKLEQGEEITTSHVKFYLQHHKRFDRRILDTCRFVKEEHVEGGVMVFVEHAPMEKYRIVLPLYEPFVVAKECGGNERAAREKWKRLYVGVASQLGASYDRSCVDISRLFFWPTHKPGGEFRVEIILGEMLDLSKVTEVDPKELENSNPFTEAGLDAGDEIPLENVWLRTWMRGKYVHFAAGEFFANYYDQRNRNGDKITTECPFDAGHSEAGNPNDQGFFCVDGDSDEKAFAAHCQHDSCSQYRRLNFVDKAVTEFGLTEEDLDQFVPEGVDQIDAPTAADEEEENAVDPSTLTGDELIQYHVDRCKAGDLERVAKVIKLLVDHQVDNLKASVFLKALSKTSGVGLGELKKTFNKEVSRINREAEERKAEENGVVMFPINGDFNDQVEAALRGIKKKNNPAYVFQTETDIVMVSHAKDGTGIRREVLSKDSFKVFLQDCIHFYQQTDNGRVVRSAPIDLVNHIFSMPRNKLPLPYLKGIRKHPVLSLDGEFSTKPGFDPYTGIYLDTQGMRLLKVPAAPTEDDLDEAWQWFFAYDGLFGDFPFKDDGDDEALEKDPDHMVGQSTKAHTLALLLLPMVREIIKGPAPAFVINKPMPGAGSGLYANVFNLTLNNEVCPTHAPPKGNGASEEFEKMILGKLITDPDNPMFFDNVERIDNNSLASAITSGQWSGRPLGTSKVVTVPVNHVWLFSGNNIDPSDELARRMIPVYIMPNMARPELRDDFYHSDLVGWCREYRAELVWALQVFINNWVAKGMPAGSKKLGSFEEWARVTGGILEAAGVDGFLENLSSWRSLSTTSNQDDVEVMEGLIKNWAMNKPFKAGELFAEIYDETTNQFDVDLPLRGRDKHTLKISFGKYLGFRKDKVYEIDGKTIKLQATGRASGGVVVYRFVEMGETARRESLKAKNKAEMEARLDKLRKQERQAEAEAA